jgi:hypothetical protein
MGLSFQSRPTRGYAARIEEYVEERIRFAGRP